MKIARVEFDGAIRIARIEGDEAHILDGGGSVDPLLEALEEGHDLAGPEGITAPLSAVRLLAPVQRPSKVLAIGLNYADHARESNLEPPPAPVTFVKTNNSICGPGDPITYRKDDSTEVDYEAELAVVIGRRTRDVSKAEALGAVFGYTACNDVSARDAQFADNQWIRGKSFDTFCPLGPWVVTTDEIPDPQALRIGCRVNGQTLQDSTTAEMIFGVADIISYLSRFMTLEAGDVIATGTPVGVGFARTPPIYLVDGDVCEIEIEGIGVLSNPVVVN